MAPHLPATPTQAMCMMIGDRAAAIALKGRFAKDQIQVSKRGAGRRLTLPQQYQRSDGQVDIGPGQGREAFGGVMVRAKLGSGFARLAARVFSASRRKMS